MNFAPLDTTLVENRLRDQVTDFGEVNGAAAYHTLKGLQDFRTGDCWVVLAAESNPAADGGQPRRKAAAAAVFGVVICARNYRDVHADAAKDEVMTYVGKSREALIGWAPAGWKDCIWLKGQVLDSDSDRVLWIDIYTTTHVLGGNP
ncbi:phage tail terminator protein [Pseudomonas aeruginosa]|jgi:hypothetical protein|uniref:phage tail terminator protein n=1 Tax=Pseudomonas aeruginosa TaxID=287 RepID=UPI001EDB7B60|nr:hypothetical protein [Pseudomonas aeruginosa]MCG3008976.1 hypothetical protein [Pseudomonas aeruginosa]MCV6567148.1 hypothetical protein [Pseudomonas aeruginosa]HBO2284461.1 hypothetical protein [Pseudomonas aeruginosa]HCL4087890.1 hypothetical protein [Pseudomonas aeruginosa]